MHFSFLLQEVLHTISAPSGQVQRIVIFKKNGVQAMVEYPFQYIFRYNSAFAPGTNNFVDLHQQFSEDT